MRSRTWALPAVVMAAVYASSLPAPLSAQSVLRLPHEIQGGGARSPFENTPVSVRGVVTARTADGFFMQTAVGSEDSDENTSEGLFVFMGDAAPGLGSPNIGDRVDVEGTVRETAPASDPGSPTRTQLSGVTSVAFLAGGTMLPAPYPLQVTDLAANGSPDQLERFEGMRVNAFSLRTISGTDANGAFYAVLNGQPRPFREPGVESGYPVLPCAVPPCNVPVFDGNPERLRVDSDGLEGILARHVSTRTTLSDVTGPLDFAERTYTLLPEFLGLVLGGMQMDMVGGTEDAQFSVASLNAARFSDVSLDVWLTKTSVATRFHLGTPDILALHGVADAATAEALAARLNDDATNDGDTSPGYRAVVVDGSDVGFLIRSRVTEISHEQVGPAEVFDRRSLLLTAVVEAPEGFGAQRLALLVNHLEAENGDVAKRHAQAGFLADYVQLRHINNPAEALVVLGDFNAPEFSDGYVDTVGAVRGNPAPADAVALFLQDVVTPDLVDVSDALAAADRYSFVRNGNAQTRDHVLVSEPLAERFDGVFRVRLNADFPDSLRNNFFNPGRTADSDPIVAFFVFPPPDEEPPVFEAVSDLTVEATSGSGAVVTYDIEATDNVDGAVAATCTPASGSQFPLGNSGVTCTATDAAGNTAQASFTVTVEDTTAPQLTVPANIQAEATSEAGRVVTFSATAQDDAGEPVEVSCTPASGSLFAVGTTVVVCDATDTSGNVAQAAFNVTIAPPPAPPSESQPGRVEGYGSVRSSTKRAEFAFDVKESQNAVDRGWLLLKVRDGNARERAFVGLVRAATFTNAPGYKPGHGPQSGVDTVVFSGTGCWNGKANHTFEVTASDRGEPGAGRDTFAVVVKAPNGAVVASVSGVLKSGNLQSRNLRSYHQGHWYRR